MPPIKLDTLYPFEDDEGCGFLVRLVGCALCVVWIGMGFPCRCSTRHLLITTLVVHGDCHAGYFIPSGVDILHSTHRRVGMLGSMATQGGTNAFCFLQSYVEHTNEVTLPSIHPMIGGVTYSEIEDSPNMLPCCSFVGAKQLPQDVLRRSTKFR